MARTSNFGLTSLKNIYVLTTQITSSYSKARLMRYFLVKKTNGEYFDLFTNKMIYINSDTKIINGILGEYSKFYTVLLQKVTHINDFGNRFKGMDIESFAALKEFIDYINIVGNMAQQDNNPQVVFEI